MAFGNNGISKHPPNESPPSLLFRTLSKWVALVLLCLWMFVLGIIVGRETDSVMLDTGKDIEEELTELNKIHMEEEISKMRTDVDFHEALRESHDVAEVPEPPPSDNRSGSDEKPIKRRSLPDKSPLFTKTAPVNGKPKAAPRETPRPKPARPDPEPEEPTARRQATATASLAHAHRSPPSPGQKKMTIQVASFKDPKAAQKRVDELKRKGYEAYRSPGIVPGRGVWHRVRIGYFSRRDEARVTIGRLKKDKLKGIVVNIKN